MRKKSEHKGVLTLVALLAAVLGQAYPANAQDRSKDIGVVRAEEIVQRPQKTGEGRTTTKASGVTSIDTSTYQPSRRLTNARPKRSMEYAQLGLTVWRLQVDGTKALDQEGEEAKLEQLEANTLLSTGSAVRLGIEPLTRNGYLYVIDREQFSDGTYGPARLIFPTLRTRHGYNNVLAHTLVLIPRPPSYFRVNPSSTGKTQTAEVLTMILSPTPLALPEPLSDQPMVLNSALLKGWEKKWPARITVLELNGGAGIITSVKAQSERTKTLDQEGKEAESLTRSDPLPQTVFRATIRRGTPFLVTVPLRFKASP
jgi:hypothetical protein